MTSQFIFELITFLKGNPGILTLVALISTAFFTFVLLFLLGYQKSGRGFWGYIAHIDRSYPVKPNFRGISHQIALASNSNKALENAFEQMKQDNRAITNQIHTLRKELRLDELGPIEDRMKESLLGIKETEKQLRYSLKVKDSPENVVPLGKSN